MKFPMIRAMVEKEHAEHTDRAMKRTDILTNYEREHFKAETQKKRAMKRAEKDELYAKRVAKLDAAENEAISLPCFTLHIEWKRGSYGAMQAKATLNADRFLESAYTTGCGYDKESSAAAKVLNASPSIMAQIYAIVEDNKKEFVENPYGTGNYKGLCYGIGGGSVPYFEGGVGIECHIKALENAGYICKHSSGKSWDHYEFTKEVH